MHKVSIRVPAGPTVPLCSDCDYKLRVPFTCGYCRRWFWITNGVPSYGRCTDMRTERCGLKNPRFFTPKGGKNGSN